MRDLSVAGDSPVRVRIDAEWDSRACVWVATSPDVAGLATEAADLGSLGRKLLAMVPELLEANGGSDL